KVRQNAFQAVTCRRQFRSYPGDDPVPISIPEVGAMLAEELAVAVDDPTALDRIFAEHRPQLHALLRRRMGPGLLAQEDPDGLLDEAHVQARLHWAEFEPPAESPETACYAWLKQIVLNIFGDVLDYYLAAKRDVRNQRSLPDDSSVLAKLGVFDRGTG